MDVAAHIEILREQGRLLAAAAEAAGADAAVPSCPGWTARDLVRHQGGVHRWATSIVATPRTEPWDVDLDDVVGTWPDDSDLIDWFADGYERLADVLSRADPALDCWTFLAAPSPLAMWARRQAHETAVHRVDAELSAGSEVTRCPAAFASDGIDELLACFITRPGGRLRADPPVRLRIRCADTQGNWQVTIGPDRVVTASSEHTDEAPGPADVGLCQITGAAHDLYLSLWNRPAAGTLVVDGDRAVLDLFADQVKVRWS